MLEAPTLQMLMTSCGYCKHTTVLQSLIVDSIHIVISSVLIEFFTLVYGVIITITSAPYALHHGLYCTVQLTTSNLNPMMK